MGCSIPPRNRGVPRCHLLAVHLEGAASLRVALLYCHWVGSLDFKLFGYSSHFLLNSKKMFFSLQPLGRYHFFTRRRRRIAKTNSRKQIPTRRRIAKTNSRSRLPSRSRISPRRRIAKTNSNPKTNCEGNFPKTNSPPKTNCEDEFSEAEFPPEAEFTPEDEL